MIEYSHKCEPGGRRIISMLNPYKDFISSITPREFEEYCHEILKAYAEEEQLKDFIIIHDSKMKANDGIYQIDIYAEFTAMSSRFKVAVECKRYSSKVSREKIAILADKMRSLAIQKGIFISTSGYQSGAIKYAKEHGITLLQIFDKQVMHIQNSFMSEERMRLRFEVIRKLPDYYAYIIDDNGLPFEKVYPTKSQEKDVISQLDINKNKI